MPTERGLLNHTAGKGDKERSSKWRENYQEINWGAGPEGFTPDGAKQVKTYRESPEGTYATVVCLPLLPAAPLKFDYNGAAGGGTYATVVCPQHGSVRLTFDAWMAQVDHGGACFVCPLCGEPALSASPDFKYQGN